MLNKLKSQISTWKLNWIGEQDATNFTSSFSQIKNGTWNVVKQFSANVTAWIHSLLISFFSLLGRISTQCSMGEKAFFKLVSSRQKIYVSKVWPTCFSHNVMDENRKTLCDIIGTMFSLEIRRRSRFSKYIPPACMRQNVCKFSFFLR